MFPLGGGNIAQLFLTRVSIPPSSYPTVASALWTGVIFDWFMGLLIMCFAFTQGVFPKPPDFSKLPAFDISFFASHMRFTLFFMTVLGICVPGRVCAAVGARAGVLAAPAPGASRSCATAGATAARWPRWQFASWIFRFAAYWALLDAFHIGGSVRNALLVLAVQVVASVFPFTPGGLGVQQALLLTIFAGSSEVAAFSVGQQIATGRAQRAARVRGAGPDLPLQELPRGDPAGEQRHADARHGAAEAGRSANRGRGAAAVERSRNRGPRI